MKNKLIKGNHMKKQLFSVLCLSGAFVFAEPAPHYLNPLNQADSIQHWWIAPKTEAKAVPGTGVEIVSGKEAKGQFQGIIRGIPVKGLQGKNVRVSVEAKAVNLKSLAGAKNAGKFMLTIRTPKETFYPDNNPNSGTYDWKKYSIDFRIPQDAKSLDFVLGSQQGDGKILYRNLQLEIIRTEAEKHNAYYFNSLTQPNALAGCWAAPGTIRRSIAGTGIEITDGKDAKGKFQGIVQSIPAKPLLGKRLRFSVEVKAENIRPVGDTKTGGKFMVSIPAGKETYYPQSNPATGTYDWKTYSFDFTIPTDAKSLNFALGLERGNGKILFRNLKVEILDTMLNLNALMNMGYADKKGGDGKGGWSDQGSDNDAKKFNFKQTVFANVPFHAVNPAENQGKSVLVFKSANFSNGLPEATLNLDKMSASGRYLYLLHTMTWGTKDQVGTIEVTGKNGEKQTIEVKGGRDVNDWWMASPGKNAHPASVWTNTSGGIVGVFASVFPLNPEIGEIQRIRFAPKSPTAIWIVLAATLSDKQYEFPKAEIETTKENATWKKYFFPPKSGVLAGSALDRDFYSKRKPVGTDGRVIINKNGDFAFEKKPEESLRFFAALFPNTYIQPGKGKAFSSYVYSEKDPADQKGVIRDMVLSFRHKGYNMFRMHCIEGELAQKKGLDFPKDVFDNFFWTIKCMKDNGIYLNLDVAASHLGYYPGITWADWTWRKDHKDAKKHIYFDQDSRENWIAGAKKMLLTKNPYTGMRLIDDPVLVCLIGFNEQEFVFSNANAIPQAMPRWTAFLEKKYGNIDKLKTAWNVKNNWKSFKDLPVFRGSFMMETNPMGRDAYEFTRMMEREIFDFYESNLRKMGWKGPFTNFNMGKSIQYVMAREPAGFVAMNSYHAHPTNYIQPGSAIDQTSSIAGSANVARGFYAYQMPGKPYVITEHGHVFWNRHRYEMAFVTDGYAALQGIAGITAFIGQDSRPHGNRIHPFGGSDDPIMYASEFLAYYIYGRGDVRPSEMSTRVVLNEKDVLDNHAYRWGLGMEQTRLSLLGKFSVEPSKDGKPVFPARKNEMMLQRTGGSAVLVSALGTAGFSSIMDGGKGVFDLDALIRDMKKRGLLPAGNRTNAAGEIFESSTGELYLDAKKSFMSIDTKRLQGVCALAGTKAKLGNLEITEMSRNGNLAAVSIDQAPDLENSSRIMVVYATDALNSGMVFNDSTRRVMQKLGALPILFESGKFTVSIKNKNAAKMKAFAVDLNGKRQSQIPLKLENGRLVLQVDTTKLPGGPTVFFEIAEK